MNRHLVPLAVMCLLLLGGCATLSGGNGPNVQVVGIEPLPSEGLEVRFALKLRVQNPNETLLAYDGMSIRLDLDGRGLASGVSNVAGEIPRFSDTVLTVPISISAFSVVRQLMAHANDKNSEDIVNKPIAYSLTGKLGAANGALGATRFSSKGDLNLFATGDRKDRSNQE